jgi:hypothetical protein
MKIPAFLCLVLAALLAACSTSSIVVGKTRPETKPDDVKIYLDPPHKFENIAIVQADSNGSFRFSAQGKIDAALGRAKREAARLGANGLLIQELGESGSVTVGNAYTSGNFTSGSAVTAGGLVKNVRVLAIWVDEE